MPRKDGTGPNETYKNCVPTGYDKLSYSGKGQYQGDKGPDKDYERRKPGTGGRGKGNMNRFEETGLPFWKRNTIDDKVKE